MAEKNKMVNRLNSLKEIEGVNVTSKGNTVRLEHLNFHALDFLFRWTENNHFTGYFIDAEGNQSQAVISLRTGMDAIHFVSAYSLLILLRAKQKKKK